MSTKKTIQINPELFKVPGSKTKKNRGKRELAINPVINPNNLKNKLLKRIKEHKNKELKESGSNSNVNNSSKPTASYSDEFYGAIDYLSDLSKKQKQEKALHNRTLKASTAATSGISGISGVGEDAQRISLELPPELEESSIRPQTDTIYNMNYRVSDNIPYGCLKNGKKQTYREWKELTNPSFDLPNMIRPPTPPKQNLLVTQPSTTSATSIREQRLEQIKDKLRRIQEEETVSKNKTLEELGMVEQAFKNEKTPILDELPDFDDKKTSMPDINELIKQRNEKIEKENPKQYTKKTVKRKFTLGKSDKLRRVAILIKNRDTRKKIVETQKKLKKTHITDVRKHLNRQGLIKIGSTCPPDIQRKIFESAMLAGDITNTNKETLLHNFLHSDKST